MELDYPKKIQPKTASVLFISASLLSEAQNGRTLCREGRRNVGGRSNPDPVFQRLGAEGKGLQLHLDYPATVSDFFCGDPLRLQQVLTNLLGNAVKFTQHGEVCLKVSGEPGAVRLAVKDTGIGIAADRLEKIFEPFAQADASMSRRFGGTGLGTTISRQLVELMGGDDIMEMVASNALDKLLQDVSRETANLINMKAARKAR